MKEQLLALSNHIHRTLGKEFNPFYVIVDTAFKIVGDSGNGRKYGFDVMEPGSDAYDFFPFLVGLEGMEEPSFKIHTVETPSGDTANVYLVNLKDYWGIAILDTTHAKESQFRYQQVANELTLVNAERDRLIKRMENYKEILQKVNKELHLANKLKSTFIGRMSHEFRTPLASILGYLDLVKEDLGSPDQVMSHLGAIDRSAHYLLNLIENLIDQSILENGQLVVHPSSTDITAIANNLEELFRITAEKKGLSFIWWLSPDIPKRVWVDEIKLRQVMINLIGNAIKFTKEGSISVSFDWDDGEMTITVDDTGQGINDADLKAIFEHFRKTANNDQVSRGAGLGLSISREIVQRMGGEMVVESSRNRGTNIKFTIVAPSRVDKSLSDDPLQNSEIVVIDGDNDSRQLIGVFLKGVGAKPYLAPSGKDAVKHLKNYSPDAVIIDMTIEGEDSINIIQNIRKTNYKGPIVALSSMDNETIRKKVNYAKCDDFFIKPLRRTDFIHKMGVLLQRKILG